MVIKVSHQETGEDIFTFMKSYQSPIGMWSALYYQFSKCYEHPQDQEIAQVLATTLSNMPAMAYYFQDGDVLIPWMGPKKATFEKLCAALYSLYPHMGTDLVHKFFDLETDNDTLHSLFKEKNCAPTIQETPVNTQKTLISEQIKQFRIAKERKRTSELPEILVVEDQAFSRNLLVGFLEKKYKTYAADDAKTGLEAYLTYAPDIVLLDIEMPGVDGLNLASFINKINPDAYIVMVTASNHKNDIAKSKQNGAKSYVLKPFTREKIYTVIDQYLEKYTTLLQEERT